MNKLFVTLILVMFGLSMSAQGIAVRGEVTSATDGEPLIGVSVTVKGGSNGVTTDIDGKYMINVKPGTTLTFSYIGFESQEHQVTGNELNVQLKEAANALDELVVVGYGAVRKSDLTGSVSSVNSDKLTKTPAASLSNALQGQVAGVSVNSLSGRPGASAEVTIRGVGTIHGAQPIYVVDGVIAENIDFLSPNDIEHVEVLKDASATAIYGSRGANGVVIVTTKGGRLDTPTHITFNGYVGVQQRWKKIDVMNAKEYADAYVGIFGNNSSKKVYNEQGFNAWLNLFQGLRSSDYYPTVYNETTNPTGFDYSKVDTDWQDEVFRDGMIQNYHLTIDGGSDKTTYSMSGSWFKQEGIIKGSDYSRFTARLNTSFQAFPWMKIGENISFMSSVAKNAYESGDNSESAGANILSAAFAMAPWDPTHYPAGYVNRKGVDMGGRTAAGSAFKNVLNPYIMLTYSHPQVNRERFVGNAYVELTPVKHLMWRTSFNFDYTNARDKSFSEPYDSPYMPREKNVISSNMSRYYYWNVDNILTYTNTFAKKHNVTAMAGFTVEESSYYGLGGQGASILNPEERNWYLNQATTDFTNPSDGVSRNRRQSWLGRVNYSFDNKYLLTVNFRADGSSKFSEHHWGYFPSFALAWRMSQESWLSDFQPLNDLKIRFGWGKVGNDNISSNDAFVLNMFSNGPSFVDYFFGQNATRNPGACVLTWINRGGHWENTEQWSAGVDFNFWNGKLSGSVDGFIRDTNDMLMSVNAPAQVGNRFAPWANVGKVRNTGIELSLDHHMYVTKDLHYNIGGNVSYIKNELVKLNGGSRMPTGYKQAMMVDEGHSLYYYNVLEYKGIFKTDQEALDYFANSAKGNPNANPYTEADIPFHAGDAIYTDRNGDGRIDDNDRMEMGKSIPTWSYGVNLGVWYRDFDLQMNFQGTAGSKIYNQMRERLEGKDQCSVFSPDLANAWTVDNPDGTIPNPRSTINWQTPSSRFLESGDYFRLKNLQLGYSLPKSILGGKGLTSCRFYAQCSNVFTVTKYKGFDPEVRGGVDFGNYPQSRTFIFGVNITY